jgi:putative DNA primase/helicase
MFLPNLNSGIWEEQIGKHELVKTVNDIRKRIETMVLIPLRTSLYEIKTNASDDDEVAETKKKQLAKAEELYSQLLFKLGNETFKNQVIKEIVNSAIIRTKEQGVTMSTFNSRKGCIGFLDGVYDLNTRQFYRGSKASEFYVTKTVDYEYEQVENIDEEACLECIQFLKTIHPDEDIRDFVLKKLSNSRQGVQEQCLLIHYNISGKNGKTTLFKLMKKTFGSYFMKCNIALLYPSSFNNPSSSNEELISLQGIQCALFSEPSTKQKLCASMIKELTGGDEQSTRRNYGQKETFVFNGLAHVLCNKIPEVDEYDGGIARRMVCVPYKSTFVDLESEVDNSKNRYLRDWDIEKKFDEWRYVIMKLLIAYGDKVVGVPKAVEEHTKKYLDRENIMKRFIEDMIEYTGDKSDMLRQTDIYQAYKEYCKEYGYTSMKADLAYDDFHNHMDEDKFKARSKTARNFWTEYKLRGIQIDSDTDDM